MSVKHIKLMGTVICGYLFLTDMQVANERLKEETKNGCLKEAVEALRVDVKTLQELQSKQAMPLKAPENASLNAKAVVKGHSVKPHQSVMKQNVRA